MSKISSMTHQPNWTESVEFTERRNNLQAAGTGGTSRRIGVDHWKKRELVRASHNEKPPSQTDTDWRLSRALHDKL